MLRQETGIGMCFVQLVLGLIDSTWEIGSQYILTHFGATVKRVVLQNWVKYWKWVQGSPD